MRVGLVCPYDLDAPGGVQVHVEDLASQLMDRGHVVEVFGPGRGGLGRPIRLPYRGTVAPIAPWPGGIRLARRAFERFSPDLVHVHEPFTPSASMWATLAATVPVVATFHAWLDRARIYEVAGPVLRPVARRLTASIAVSQAAAAFVDRAVPGLEPVVIANGVSVSRFAEAPRLEWPLGRRIAWAHRLDPQKGFPVVVEAFRRLALERTDLLLSVGGDGADRVAVDGLPSSVRARISMFGRVGHDEVPSLLAGADVAVAAATGQESFGIALVEAMAAGVPVAEGQPGVGTPLIATIPRPTAAGRRRDPRMKCAAAPGGNHRRHRPALALAELALVGHRLAVDDQHVEAQRLVAVRLELDLVRTFVEAQLLEVAVEVVDCAGKRAVDEHLGLARLDPDAQSALALDFVVVRIAAGVAAAAVARIAVAPRPAEAIARAEPERIPDVAQAPDAGAEAGVVVRRIARVYHGEWSQFVPRG